MHLYGNYLYIDSLWFIRESVLVVGVKLTLAALNNFQKLYNSRIICGKTVTFDRN